MMTKKINSIFLLILFVFESFWPTLAIAITNKGVQVDFASYEEMATNDMVNTMTGDFTYNIPLIDIPSPEGGFQMPLSYHAGIQMEEESSWVGLGWALNPGVLTRDISIYPDDYDSSQVIKNYSYVQSAGGSGWRTSVLGFSHTYDSNKGFSDGYQFGNILGYSKSDASGVGVNILGTSKDKHGWSFDVDKFAQGSHELGIIIATSGGGVGATIINSAITVASVVDAYAATKNSPNNTTNYSPELRMGPTVKDGWFTKTESSNYWFEGSGDNKALGVLYMGNYTSRAQSASNIMEAMPHPNGMGQLVFNGTTGTWGGASSLNQPKVIGCQGPVGTNMQHDFHGYYEENVPLSYQCNPHSIAYDGFSVLAGGACGSISPYRYEAGSFVGSIFSKYSLHKSLDLTSFLKNKTNIQNTGYKVPFRYLGDPSNNYDFCLTTDINNEIKTKYSTDWNESGNSNYFQVSIFDPKIYCTSVASGSGSGRTAKEGNRSSTDPSILTHAIKNDKMVHRKNIDWYSNYEISNSQTDNFMDCGISRNALPVNGIGGFSVTREDGLTYHFSIPVYNKKEYKKFVKVAAPDIYSVTDNNSYATHWLLTGITGADFVDRGTIGRIDDADWGYWVKLDYGMYNNNFFWRTPYRGYDITSDNTQTFSRGIKQTYYLNTIRTRSHTAIFSKSIKKDGRSYYETDSNGSDPSLSLHESGVDPIPNLPSNSLKLDQIYILNNLDFDNLKAAPYNITKLNQDYNHSLNNATTVDNISNNVILSSDFTTAGASAYLENNRLKGIEFIYNYDLCGATLNSWDVGGNTPNADAYGVGNTSRKGKLTLGSIRLWGPGSQTMFSPTYEFDYGQSNGSNNPGYSPERVDDFGFFKYENSAFPPAGTVVRSNVGNATPSGSEWSLKKITTPMGAEINIEYERDTYSEVNGKSNGWYPMKVEMIKNAPSPDLVTNVLANSTWRIYTHPRFGNLNLHLMNGNLGNIKVGAINFNFNISAIDPSGTYFEFTSTDPNCTQANINTVNSSNYATVQLCVVTGLNYNNQRYAGDLRVRQIMTLDELGNQYATRYDYHNSGVASFETQSTKVSSDEFDKLFDHPRTPIIYGKVSVLSGKIKNSVFEANSKTEYKFITPHRDFLTVDRGTAIPYGNTETNDLNDQYNLGAYTSDYMDGDNSHNFGANGSSYKFRAKSGHIIIKDKTSKIGQIKQVTNYNSRNEVISQIKYDYADGDGNEYLSNQTEWNMGKYGESNFIFEVFVDPQLSRDRAASNPGNITYYDLTHRLIQTSKVKYPCALKSYTINNGGVIATKNISQWDYFTGTPLITETRIGGPNADLIETFITPAYFVYPEMGSKVMDPKNKNIMNGLAQETKKVNYNDILESKVTTWSNGTNYRLFDATNNTYVSTSFPYTTITQIGPYHPHKQYVWKSTVGKDGLIPGSSFTDFDFTNTTQDARWAKTSEVTLYSKYSKVLEALDINNKKISTKYSESDSHPIATIENCGYGEWCFSSAEDNPAPGNEVNYFGGEVYEAQHRYDDSFLNFYAHTGRHSLKVPGGNSGFTFKGSFGSSGDFKPNKKYKASVWVHVNTRLDGELYVETRNSTGLVSTNVTSIGQYSTKESYGNIWYQMNLEFTTPSSISGSNPYLVFGCRNKNTSAANFVYFDDFRVNPYDAAFEVSVIDPKTGDLVATLDAENIATRYSYNTVHRLKSVEKETKQGFKKISEYNYGTKR